MAVYGCQDQGCGEERTHFPSDLRVVANPPEEWGAGWYCEECLDEILSGHPDTEIGESLESHLAFGRIQGKEGD